MITWLSPLGAVLGAVLALGLYLIARGAPLTRGPDLSARIEPYLDRAPQPSRLLHQDRSEVRFSQVLTPLATSLARRLDRVLGGAESVRSRLMRADATESAEGFRIQQVLWAITAAVLMAFAGSLLWWVRGVSLPVLAIVVGCAGIGGAMARDALLTRAAVRREHRIMAEFPALAELLALSVTAGESTVQALERVSRLSSGALSTELDTALSAARTGTSLPEALQGISNRTGLAPVARFVDGIVVAIQRGTPLGEVLRAQAQDARESARQSLIEEGGKREIAMMIPVVFLVLPVTVVFAAYPGLALLQLSI
ncbi:MAG TPA: type II secretion system F family protein [Ornithinimicrobium sp.]|uniref:type II secretion system F family protein n=1 Tax=Ornithinimicrobium sp. TaxID=1977084 RepID=UPI002B465CA8|nr:type II secretion system F family protein [Ornithinimicrobium sp.]HKJ11231.1 type II secretion system F family protein [Ornithinimicrobium sp.]